MFAMNDGIRICYDVAGKGVPLVLQHGSPQDSDDWRQSGYVGRLSERFPVVLIDAPAEAAVRFSYENACHVASAVAKRSPDRKSSRCSAFR